MSHGLARAHLQFRQNNKQKQNKVKKLKSKSIFFRRSLIYEVDVKEGIIINGTATPPKQGKSGLGKD